MSEEPVLLRVSAGIACITLNRPERHNAVDDGMIAGLERAFESVASDHQVRAVVLEGAGRSFCAGADLDWMRRTAALSEPENEAEALRLADLLGRLDGIPKPTLARVHGNVFGGGIGLVAACDVAVAVAGTRFAFSEVRLGLIPAVIAPYAVRAMGPQAARRYMLTGDVFDAAEACALGLISEVVEAELLDGCCEEVLKSFLASGPQAISAAKQLIATVAGRPIDDALRRETARRIARTRAGDEAAEGITAFFERRRPGWHDGG